MSSAGRSVVNRCGVSNLGVLDAGGEEWWWGKSGCQESRCNSDSGTSQDRQRTTDLHRKIGFSGEQDHFAEISCDRHRWQRAGARGHRVAGNSRHLPGHVPGQNAARSSDISAGHLWMSARHLRAAPISNVGVLECQHSNAGRQTPQSANIALLGIVMLECGSPFTRATPCRSGPVRARPVHAVRCSRPDRAVPCSGTGPLPFPRDRHRMAGTVVPPSRTRSCRPRSVGPGVVGCAGSTATAVLCVDAVAGGCLRIRTAPWEYAERLLRANERSVKS